MNRSVMPLVDMNHANALVLTEKTCHIACINRIYHNPPVELTTRDCITAERVVPCALCCTRSGRSIVFEHSSVATPFPVQHLSLATTSKKKRNVLDTKKKEREQLDLVLVDFGNSVWQAESTKQSHQYRPKASYFPTTMKNEILEHFLRITSLNYLTTQILERNLWPFTESQGPALYDLILSQLLIIQGERYRLRVKTQKRQQANSKRKDREDTDDDDNMEEEISDSELLPSPTAPKRPALEPLNTANNATRSKPKPRAKPVPQPSSKQVLDSYQPERPNFRRANEENEGDETNGPRRSSRLRR